MRSRSRSWLLVPSLISSAILLAAGCGDGARKTDAPAAGSGGASVSGSAGQSGKVGGGGNGPQAGSGAGGTGDVGGTLAAAGDAAGGDAAGSAGADTGPFETTLTNFAPGGRQVTRFDTDGHAVDAHDGEVVRFGDQYYLYGTSYGCGYAWGVAGAPFCGFKVYTSTDLVHWQDRGQLFDASTPTWQARCNGSTYGCYRPHVVYNESTSKYVLWVNVYDNQVGFRVFTSTTPLGPFVEEAEPTLAVNADAAVAGLNNGDHDTFIDEDGTAFLAFTDWRAGGAIAIEKLNASYLSGTGEVATGVTPNATEAPSLFRRGELYYVTYSDPNCGYCGKGIANTGSGTGTSYRTAASPLGPWSAGKRIISDSCGGQPAFVATLPTATGLAYLYGSDLWNDTAKNEAVANFYWAPLSFAADGSIEPHDCQETATLELETGEAGQQAAIPDLDHGSGVDGFSSYCDVAGAIRRSQTFVASRSGTLARATFTTFRMNGPDAGLTFAIHAANAAFQPQGAALYTSTVSAETLSFAPRQVTVTPQLAVTAGSRYALVLHSTATTGCYGLEYDDSAVANGAAYSNDGGAVFQAEAGRRLKLDTTIEL